MNVTRLEMYKNNNLASCDFDPHLSESSKFKESPNTESYESFVCVLSDIDDADYPQRALHSVALFAGMSCTAELSIVDTLYHRRCRRRFHGTMSWICITCMYRRMTIQGLRLLILVLEASISMYGLVLSVTLLIVFYCYPIATTGFVIRKWQPTSLLGKITSYILAVFMPPYCMKENRQSDWSMNNSSTIRFLIIFWL